MAMKGGQKKVKGCAPFFLCGTENAMGAIQNMLCRMRKMYHYANIAQPAKYPKIYKYLQNNTLKEITGMARFMLF